MSFSAACKVVPVHNLSKNWLPGEFSAARKSPAPCEAFDSRPGIRGGAHGAGAAMSSGRFRQVGGDFDGDERAAAGVADDLEVRLISVEDFEALLHVLHADAGSGSAQG